MITGLFLFQLFVTFLTGSIWIFLIVLAGKRFGSKTAGFIGGLPSTAVLSFFFIGFTQSPETASEATTIFPIVYGVTALFLVVYAWQIKKGIFIALSSGLIVWIILSTIIILLDPDNFIIILFCYILILLCVYFLLERILKITSYGRVLTNYTNRQIAFRSLFGGLIIMMAVLFAKIGGPVFGGMFAAFPAMFISTLVISYKVHGADFSRALTKPLMITGMITIVIYVIAVKYLYIYTGLYIGTILSMTISAISAYFTYVFLQRKLK